MTPEATAISRIEEALASNATELNLSSLKLTAIPEQLGQLGNLQYLRLDNNQLPDALMAAFERGLGDFRTYLQGMAEEQAELLYEAKLVLVGDGKVGKSGSRRCWRRCWRRCRVYRLSRIGKRHTALTLSSCRCRIRNRDNRAAWLMNQRLQTGRRSASARGTLAGNRSTG